MENIENILDMLGTIRRLEKLQMEEADPRVRAEIAETLDLLNPSFDRMLVRYANSILAPQKKLAA